MATIKKQSYMTQQFSDFYDLLLDSCIDKESEFQSVADVKAYLHKKEHPEKDNASFCYDFFQFCKEPFCIK